MNENEEAAPNPEFNCRATSPLTLPRFVKLPHAPSRLSQTTNSNVTSAVSVQDLGFWG